MNKDIMELVKEKFNGKFKIEIFDLHTMSRRVKVVYFVYLEIDKTPLIKIDGEHTYLHVFDGRILTSNVIWMGPAL